MSLAVIIGIVVATIVILAAGAGTLPTNMLVHGRGWMVFPERGEFIDCFDPLYFSSI